MQFNNTNKAYFGPNKSKHIFAVAVNVWLNLFQFLVNKGDNYPVISDKSDKGKPTDKAVAPAIAPSATANVSTEPKKE